MSGSCQLVMPRTSTIRCIRGRLRRWSHILQLRGSLNAPTDTLGDDVSIAQAQVSLDEFCVRVGDARRRVVVGGQTTVGALGAAEPLRTPPQLPYPVSVSVARVVSAQALVAFGGNFYSVGPGMSGATIEVRRRLDAQVIEIATTGGVVLARHRREPDGAGVIARHDEHVVALERAVLAAFSDRAPCRSKERRPPSRAALAEAARLGAGPVAVGDQVVVDFADYVAAAKASAATLLALASPHQGAGDE